jgi:NDP-sugar pyrophosphorylase family protein
VTVEVCAVVLSAGQGTRLRPITATLPKPLCPVGNVALLDRALARLAAHGLAGPDLVAVNTCYLAEAIESHVDGRAHLSREPGPPALGTSGALHQLRDWIGGRAVLAMNSDAYLSGNGRDLAPLLDGWTGRTVRVLTVPAGGSPPEFPGEQRFAGASLLPADLVAGLPPGPSELVLTLWRPAQRAGRLEVSPYGFRYLDTGTPRDYLAANLDCLPRDGGSLVAADASVTGWVSRSVIGPQSRVAGSASRSVILPGATVSADEALVEAIRIGPDITLQVEEPMGCPPQAGERRSAGNGPVGSP